MSDTIPEDLDPGDLDELVDAVEDNNVSPIVGGDDDDDDTV